MRLGDPSMYIAWGALAIYCALYFPVFVACCRVAVHRFSVPLTIAAPVVWVGLEYLRAFFFTGFSWYYLGHTQYRWVEMIQISDLTGAYGVSAVVAMVAALLAGLLPVSLLKKCRLVPQDGWQDDQGLIALSKPKLQVVVCLALFSAALVYGFVRRSQADFQPGPKVALIQGNYTASLKHDPNEWSEIYRRHEFLTGQMVKYQPDIILWPETMFRWPLFVSPLGMSEQQLQAAAPQIPPGRWTDTSVQQALTDMSQKSGAAMILGLETYEAQVGDVGRYNSAVLVTPNFGITKRYDKLHLVPFGEYLPLKETLPFLQAFSPIPSEFSLKPGKQPVVFEYGGWNLAPIICFEDTVPYLVRQIVKNSSTAGPDKNPVDCLVNLTNDGWFHGSSELDQHLITAAFRAVECRTPLIRAVNTGISAVIDGDGVVREPEIFFDGDNEGRDTLHNPKTGRWHKQLNAAVIDTVPLDSRRSLYVAYGDWFAMTCCSGTLFFALGGIVFRRKKSGTEAEPADTSAESEESTQA
jgi:apolipoprotein N-acyltransferase